LFILFFLKSGVLSDDGQMELVEKDCWVEVRPLITSKLESGNFAPVLDALHNLGKPFRFFITAPKEGSEERSLVRFFFQFFDEPTRVQMSNIIRTLLDVEVIGGANPPKHQYRFCTDLEMTKNYAQPLVFNCQRQELAVNLVDQMVASVAGLGVCIEVVAQADPNATLGIQKFVYDKLSSKSSGVSTVFFDSLGDLIGAGIGKDPKNETSATKGGRSGAYKINSWSRELVKNAELKLTNNLFTCQIRIWSNSLQNAHSVKKALPAAPTNRLKTFKTTKPPKHPTTALKAPSRYVLRNNILCRLWWAVPLSILLFAWVFGLFHPLKLVLSASISTAHLGFFALETSLAFCLFIAFRRRNAIVLSTQELSQIIGLPTAIEKLPIALGKVPLSRMQLCSQPTPTTKEEEKEEEKEEKVQEAKSASFENKEEQVNEQTQEPNSLSVHQPLAVILKEEDSLADF
jgi:hypothetical protein